MEDTAKTLINAHITSARWRTVSFANQGIHTGSCSDSGQSTKAVKDIWLESRTAFHNAPHVTQTTESRVQASSCLHQLQILFLSADFELLIYMDRKKEYNSPYIRLECFPHPSLTSSPQIVSFALQAGKNDPSLC